MSARVGAVEAVVMDVHLPAGVAGPDPLSFDVRCFLVAHPTGVVLIDTCLPGSDGLIAAALERIGAEWSDITDILLTHAHADHIGGLPGVTPRAPGASVWAGAEDQARIPFAGQWQTLAEGGRVRELHVLETPGHTPGHCSLVHEDASLLFAGDLVGTMAGTLTRSPAAFTQDAELAERSLQRVAELHYDRVLFSHGGEIPEPMDALRQLVRTEAAVASTRNSRTSPRSRCSVRTTRSSRCSTPASSASWWTRSFAPAPESATSYRRRHRPASGWHPGTHRCPLA